METDQGRPSTTDFNNFVVTGKRGNRRILFAGILSTLLFAALFALKPTLLQTLDFKNYDLLLERLPHNHAGDWPVIVEIDEKSLGEYGQWPWPRYQVAALLEKIAALKPAVIALDMVFAEPDRTSAGSLLKHLGEAYHINLTVDRLPEELTDNDRILAEALTKGPFVLAYKFHFSRFEKHSERCILHPVKVSVLQKAGERDSNPGVPESTGALCNLTILSEKVSASGFFNSSPDQDGMLRRLPLLIQHNGEVYPSLALAVVLKYKAVENLLLKKDGDALQTINFKGTSVPVDLHGQMLIKFRGSRPSYDSISAADIMGGGVSAERLRGRIAFVGASAAGLKDSVTTPFDRIFPGVEVHTTVVDNLLTGDFIAVPSWSTGLILLLVFFPGLSLSLLLAFSNASFSLGVMLFFIGGVWLAAQQLFFRAGLFVGPAFPIASLVCIYIFLTVLKYRLEEKRLVSGMRELLLTQDITIESLANLAEYRDPQTGGHIKRTRRYVRLLAEHIRHNDKYKNFLTDANIDMLYKSAPLHDIGKVGMPDHILLKPAPLTRGEFQVMMSHTFVGRDVIESSVRKLGKKSFLTIAAEIAHSHHEKWNGSGYPQGLKGNAIPISGRLMALADVYDALISKRVYKVPCSHSAAVEIIKEGRGTHFDPDMVDAFLEINEQFRNIAREFADAREEREALEDDIPAGDSIRNL